MLANTKMTNGFKVRANDTDDSIHINSLTFVIYFERIAKTYRKESWHTVLKSILRWPLKCQGNRVWDTAIEIMAGRIAV